VPDRPDRNEESQRRAWFRMSGIGLEFASALGVCLAAGWWLDRKFGTGHWLLAVGGAIGFAVGLTQLVRSANKSFKD
jgi:F0F1-type ATP synthase assembly protein I